jgi:transposase
MRPWVLAACLVAVASLRLTLAWHHGSGGKTNIVGLSKKTGNCRLRSILILGARAYVYKLNQPKSSKDKWLKANIERNGESRAAIALANKNVRTAWAMVTQGTEYQRRGQLKVAA